MKAVIIDRQQQKGRLALQEVIDLPCPYGHVCIDIHATSVNRADILQVMGLYPGDYKINGLEIPGLECAGTIAQVGEGVTTWQKVIGFLPFCQAEVTRKKPLFLRACSCQFRKIWILWKRRQSRRCFYSL